MSTSRPVRMFTAFCFAILSILIGQSMSFAAGSGEKTRRDYMWIYINITITGSADEPGGTTPYCADQYVFEIDSDGGELANAMINAMEEVRGSIMVPDARFNGNPNFFTGRNKLIFDGPRMTNIQEDGRSMTITLSPIPSSRELLRRAHYPVEPTEENNWEGWPQP